jgi:hypothetical protein
MAKMGFKIGDLLKVIIVHSGSQSVYFGNGRPFGWSQGRFFFDDCTSRSPVEIPDKGLPPNLNGMDIEFQLKGSDSEAKLNFDIFGSKPSYRLWQIQAALKGAADVWFVGKFVKRELPLEELRDLLHDTGLLST